jgi:bidirectional [NiFe] hydrogenase diaphorase subunit
MITLEDLTEIAEKEQESQAGVAHHVHVCVAASCLSLKSDLVKQSLEKEVRQGDLDRQIDVKGVGCMGLCMAGPLVSVNDEVLYQNVTPADAPDLVKGLVQGTTPLDHLKGDLKAPFFSKQVKVVLENCGRIDPERIEDYIAADGYRALLDTLETKTPADVCQEIQRSGLRGRGGGGYPTGLKWSTVLKSSGQKKYVICNADEGDPGAFMDRSLLESDPHRVIEGMAIAAYATGASQGFLYVRAEYPLAVKRLRTAIRQAERLGLLGANIHGTTFTFTVDTRLGAGAFVCGEETALIASIEGGRGMPRPRPPYPAESGLWGFPTLINNVETFANVPPIVRNGGAWFAKLGTAKSKGTKVFALAGRVRNTGLIEVPMGMTLREIIEEIGGGVPEGRSLKAVQTGGPSGGCIPVPLLDMPVDYESLAQAGSMMGSGGMIVMDDSSCMVDVAKFFMEFCRTESCGRCTPCRVGTVHMHQLLAKITSGQATQADLDLLVSLCDVVRNTSLCGLGQTSPNPVLSTLRYFQEEYERHIDSKECGAGVCKIKPGAEVHS